LSNNPGDINPKRSIGFGAAKHMAALRGAWPGRAMAWLGAALRPRGVRSLAQMLFVFLLGGVAAWLMVPRPKAPLGKAEAPRPARVLVLGEPLSLDLPEEEALAQTLAIGRKALAVTIKLNVPKAIATRLPEATTGVFEQSRESLGVVVDAELMAQRVHALYDPRSALRRAHAARRGGDLELPLALRHDTERTLGALMQIKESLDRPPVDARYNLQKRAIAPDTPGLRLDVHRTMDALDVSLARDLREVELQLDELQARRTEKDLGAVVVDDVLGYFETKYANDWAHQARAYNLKLAASKLDGHVMLPGEIFDFNEVVGPRSEAYGYKVASVIAQGEVVDGIGGGTCQVSGTLHGAAIFAGLDVVERRPHSRPSFYIKMGMDATVVYPTITLRLRNPYPFPVVLHETIQDGIARAEILGPPRLRDVTFVRKIDAAVPFQEKEIPDASIPKGERQLSQRGIPGFRVTRYRVVREGAFAVRERLPDYYPPTTQIWKIGTGPKDPKWEPKDDPHPEYVADQWLIISQGPSIRANASKGGGTVESRTAGKYGSYGWTFREGLTKYRDRNSAKGDGDEKTSPD
jgi:vancomycin resistance protein YoaR